MNMKQKPTKAVIHEDDDVSSESSIDSCENADALESYMQECYYHAYQQFEMQAR